MVDNVQNVTNWYLQFTHSFCLRLGLIDSLASTALICGPTNKFGWLRVAIGFLGRTNERTTQISKQQIVRPRTL